MLNAKNETLELTDYFKHNNSVQFRFHQVVKLTWILYGKDSYLIYQYTDVNKTEKKLLENFENLCDWPVENELCW